ncbi:hypothetical protein HYDPIDRAFT_109282 [Hydnomerulius pinastri MD-312]|nr:hypothetical protein HYDPIDRAFT_109282 [Hydnomerulius pinastri MD-312]
MIKGKGKGKAKPNTPEVGLSASDTLLQISAPPHRSTSELRTLLGNSSSRLKPNSSLIPRTSLRKAASTGDLPNWPTLGSDFPALPLALEKAKSRARVEVDIVLESETCVQGGWLKGLIKLHIRKPTKKQSPMLLSKGKVRVVGYEAIPYENTRCTFYQCTALLSDVAPAWSSVFAGPSDGDGWAEAKEGVHVLPFAMFLPLDGSCGTAKGILSIHSGVALKYVAMASIKLKDQTTSAQSVAHFYRSCEIWPRLSIDANLSPAPRPLVSEAVKSVFMGGNGKVKLSVKMHRLHWVAGQRCVVHLRVVNESKKVVKSAGIALVRTTTVFKPTGRGKGSRGGDPDPDACETTTMKKVVAASLLLMGQKSAKGHASAKGWWTGVNAGETAEFAHHIIVPVSITVFWVGKSNTDRGRQTDALTVARVRLLEVEYTLKVSVTTGGLSSDVQVILPIRIINFLSLDPPPSSPLSQPRKRVPTRPQLGTHETWYRKSRTNIGSIAETEETVPGMKYSSTDMTVVAQPNEELGPSATSRSIVSHHHAQYSGHDEIQETGNMSADSASIYPPSESAATITQQRTLHDSQFFNGAESLDAIDRVIGSDSRIRDFVTGPGSLTTSRSVGSHMGPRGPRSGSMPGVPLPRTIAALDPQAESTPPKRVKSNTFVDRVQEKMMREKGAGEGEDAVKPFVERQPDRTRASSMLVMRAGVDGREGREGRMGKSRSDMLGTPIALTPGARSSDRFARA